MIITLLFKNKKGVISHIRIVHFDQMMEIRDKDIESVFNEKATEAEVKIAEELTSSTVVEQNTSIPMGKKRLCARSRCKMDPL